jgi:hypothetical protein
MNDHKFDLNDHVTLRNLVWSIAITAWVAIGAVCYCVTHCH